jgi:hypothetical protein
MQYTAACCIIFLLLFGTGCEKVIDVKLDNAAKKYVIEGVVTDQPGTCMVLLSQTKNFEDDNEFAGVSGARVQITEPGGATTLLTETSAGVYQATGLTGASGNTYELAVTINGQSFTASSTMPQPVNMDSIFVTDDQVIGKARKLVNVQFKDPAAMSNNYRFIQYVNGLKEQQIFIRNDELTNGNTNLIKLRYPRSNNKDNDLQSGDQIKVDMLCIDSAVYKYWYSLNRSATGGGGQMSATPANPVTNITGGALGYFSAHTLQSKTMVVP